MTQLPSIVEVLKKMEFPLRNFTFIKPLEGKELKKLLEMNSSNSPKATILSPWLLTLPAETIIPYHFHHSKEKVYKFERGGTVYVAMFEAENTIMFGLNDKLPFLAIPPNTPHAVINQSIDPSTIFVIGSTNVRDCTWEVDTEELLKNEHRK